MLGNAGGKPPASIVSRADDPADTLARTGGE
jgi:hypothetical protein